MESLRKLILMGSGLDSSYRAAHLSRSIPKGQVLGIHFDYGQPASIRCATTTWSD
jgi:7-cyano-7-deazaguanine synthase in queuosine biosynthesis